MASRPYIICHMLTALDGKITGPYIEDPAIRDVLTEYESLNGFFQGDAWLCGRVTTEECFTSFAKPLLDDNAPLVPEGDYVACADAPLYYVSIDPSGRVGWQSNTLCHKKRSPAHIIEVLTQKASNSYRAFLRSKEISYIIAGEEHLDCSLLASKLTALFGIKKLVLAGGGFINWSFLQEGLIDELSVLIAPTADGETRTVTLFEKAEYLPPSLPAHFQLKSVEKRAGDSVWLRYTPK